MLVANGYVTKCCIDETDHEEAVVYDVRKRDVLAIYQEDKEKREDLSARAEVKGCEGCFHLG